MADASWLRARVLVVGVALAAASGCTGTLRMYDGPQRPETEIAVIRPKLHDAIVTFVASVEIVRIDGRDLRSANDSAEVLPGPHTVTASRGAGTGPRIEVELRFEAKAGHVYEVEGQHLSYNPPSVAIWITDTIDQSVVAGTPPPAGG